MRVRVPVPMLRGTSAFALALASSPSLAETLAVPGMDVPDAQLPAGPGTSGTYLPADFARFAPRNALDMLKLVPGFQIRAQDDARGLGQASGNILINGERLSSKSDSAEDQLARIPADNVLRIEIVDGATLNIPGLSGRVANIHTQTGRISGQFQWDAQAGTEYAQSAWTHGRISVSGATGPVDYTLALANGGFRGGSGGPVFIRDATGAILQERERSSQTSDDRPKVSGSFKIDGPGSSIANLNLSYQWSRFKRDEWEDRFASGGLIDAQRTLNTHKRGYDYEISGDFEFALGPGRLRLIGLERYAHSDFDSQAVIDFSDARSSVGDRFELISDSGERIARAEYSWPMLAGDWQLSAEGAFNRLDNIAGLFLLDPTGSFTPIPFPAGTGGVTEDRYEAMLSYGRALSDRLTMQLVVGGEYSTIAQTGPNAERRSFSRPKGSLSLAWAPQAGLDISLEIRRAVGQLDFGDFLAEVNLEDNNANAGNNQLVPQQSWEAELQLAKNLGRWGTATLTLYEHRIADYVTIVPLAGGVESFGNLDTATLRGVRFASTFQLDPAGLKGGRLGVDLEFRDSELIDPVSERRRAFDNSPLHSIKFDFRHDVPGSDWAWGLEFRDTKSAPYYRLAEYGYSYDIGTFGGLFVEHKDVFGLTVKARYANVLGGSSVLYRTVHEGPRNAAPVIYIEDHDGFVGPFWTFQVKGSF